METTTQQIILKTSEQIEKIAPAVVIAQSKIKTVTKDALNSYFKKADGNAAPYATLDAIIEAIKQPLSDAELAVIQCPGMIDGKTTLLTRIQHKSGQFYELLTPIFAKNNDMQSFGAAITYAKRYVVGSFFLIATEVDDDGNFASGKTEPQKKTENKKSDEPKKTATPPETDFKKYKMKLKTKDKSDIGKSFAELSVEKTLNIYEFLEKKPSAKLTPDEAEFMFCAYKFLQSVGVYPPDIDTTENVPT